MKKGKGKVYQSDTARTNCYKHAQNPYKSKMRCTEMAHSYTAASKKCFQK